MTVARQLADVLSQWYGEDVCSEISSRAKAKRRRRRPKGAERDESLNAIVESEVIPRLMLAHGLAGGRADHRGPQITLGQTEIAELTDLAMQHDVAVAAAYVEALKSRGATVDGLYLNLIAPAARLMGEMWKADLCDFADVTIGLSRLQHIVHEQSAGMVREPNSEHTNRRMLLVPAPGEQHTLGVMILEEFIRREGWWCRTETPRTDAALADIVKSQYFDVVGISASCEVLLDDLRSAIACVRRVSMNKEVLVLVGGPIFNAHPEYVAQVGGDGTARDGQQAVLQLRSMLEGRLTGIR